MASEMAIRREVVGEYVEGIRVEVGLKMVGLVLVCLESLLRGAECTADSFVSLC